MGGFTLPQVAIAAILGGNGPTNVLGGTAGKGSAIPGPGGSLQIPQGACDNTAVNQLLGGDPPRHPACSP